VAAGRLRESDDVIRDACDEKFSVAVKILRALNPACLHDSQILVSTVNYLPLIVKNVFLCFLFLPRSFKRFLTFFFIFSAFFLFFFKKSSSKFGNST